MRRSRLVYYPSRIPTVASGYSALSRRDNHLLIEFKANQQNAMKAQIYSLLNLLILCSINVIVFSFLTLITPFLFALIFFIIYISFMIGCIFGIAWSQSWKMLVFHAEMDKISNKLSFYVPNPNPPRRGIKSRIGDYSTQTWDLSTIVFRMGMSRELTGHKHVFLRMLFKNQCFLSLGTADMRNAVIFFASKNAELTRSLMSELENFTNSSTKTEDYKDD